MAFISSKGKMAELTNSKILKTAIQTLEKEGWNGFSMRGLAKKLDVDPMAVYHYYPSKENLIHASIEKCLKDLFGNLWRIWVSTQVVWNLSERLLQGRYPVQKPKKGMGL